MAKPEKYSHIKFTPPNGARLDAEQALKWRREFGRGGTAVGIARARDISNGVELSPSTVRRMKAYFDRHEIDRKAEGFRHGEKGFPSNGRIAWDAWGGDTGRSWAEKVVRQMNAADDKDEERSLRPFGSSQGIKPKVSVVYGPPASGKSTYVDKNRGSNDVVFDFDRVMQAISGLPPHQKNENLISYCTDIRKLIIDKSLRNPKVDRTWIIATRADDSIRESLGDIPVDYVEMKATKEECLKRAEEDPARQPVLEETRQVIERYFEEKSERSSPVVNNVERRYLGNFSQTEAMNPDNLRVEQRADPATGKPQTYIVGYAARFGKDSLLLGDFVERISPTAFEIVENRKDLDGKPLETRCLFNHSPDHLLGRFPTTMRLIVDEQGLKYECLLPESRSDLKELISRGDLKGSSFSFIVAEGGERWTSEEGRSIRTVTKIKSLLDCGPVTYPAYDSATVAVAKRSYNSFVAEKRQKSEAMQKADLIREESKRFLAERRDCGRDEGGKFAKGNSCAGATEAGAGDSAWASGAKVGAILGAGLGSIGGGVGIATGAALGAVGGAVVGTTGLNRQDALKGAYKKTGTDLSKVDKAAKSLGMKMKVFAFDKNTVAMESGDSIALITDGSQFSKDAKGVSFHYQPGADAGGKFSVSSVEKAAKAVGAKNVSVEAWSDKDVKALEAKGYKKVVDSPGGYSTSKGVYEKKTGKSRRSYDDLMAFYESRAGDCGRDEGGRFGSGNKCQDEGDGEEDVFSKYGNGPIVPKSDPAGKYGNGPIVPKSDPAAKYGNKSPAKSKTAPPSGKKSFAEQKPSAEPKAKGLVKTTGRVESNEPAKKSSDDGQEDVFSKYGSGPIVPKVDPAGKYGNGPIVPKVDPAAKYGHQSPAKSKTKPAYEKHNAYKAELAPLRQALKEEGVNWVAFATASNDAAKSGNLSDATRKGSYRIALAELKKGKDAFRKHLDGLGIKKRSLSESSGRRSYDDLMAFYESRAGDCGRDEGGKFGGGNKCAGDGKYAEWKKGDHKDKAKEKETQDFIDKAREDQTISAGKDGGKSDDGGGVQTWSKGDDYPWTAKQVGTDDGYVQGQHPDGSKTEKYPFKGDSAEAYKKVSEEIKRRKGSRASQVVSGTLKFLRDRRA
jgi:HK97 family phage prohead protease